MVIRAEPNSPTRAFSTSFAPGVQLSMTVWSLMTNGHTPAECWIADPVSGHVESTALVRLLPG